MIDTLSLQFRISLPQDTYSSWGIEKTQKKSGYSLRYMSVVPAKNGAEVTYRYIPYTPQRQSLLFIEFSLPHLVFGDNIHMVYDIQSAVNRANELLPTIPGVPTNDLWKGTLCRLDVCYNHQTGDLVPFYIQALYPLEFSRRKTKPYTNQGVQFGNKQVSLKLYDKERLYIDKKLPVPQNTHGILRQETTLRRNAIKRLTGIDNPTLRSISIEMLLDAAERELAVLGLLNCSIGTHDTTLRKLCETYGTDAGLHYFGVLVAKVDYPSRDTIITTSGMHPRTLDRRLKRVLTAGIPLTMTKTDEPLPPLTIDREFVLEKAKQEASVMKYKVIQQAHTDANFSRN